MFETAVIKVLTLEGVLTLVAYHLPNGCQTILNIVEDGLSCISSSSIFSYVIKTSSVDFGSQYWTAGYDCGRMSNVLQPCYFEWYCMQHD